MLSSFAPTLPIAARSFQCAFYALRHARDIINQDDVFDHDACRAMRAFQWQTVDQSAGYTRIGKCLAISKISIRGKFTATALLRRKPVPFFDFGACLIRVNNGNTPMLLLFHSLFWFRFAFSRNALF